MRQERLQSPELFWSLVRESFEEYCPKGIKYPEDLKRIGERSYLTVEWERAWAVNCSMSIGLSNPRLEDIEAEGKRAVRMEYHPSFEISWSATGRSVAVATAALKLYREVLDLLALIESKTLAKGPYGRVEIIEEPERRQE